MAALKTSCDLVTLDPGKRHIALAFWNAEELHSIDLLETGEEEDINSAINDLLAHAASKYPLCFTQLAVLEYMRFRRDDRKSVGNDLIDVSLSGMAVASRIARRVWLLSANQWKRQAPKSVVQDRIYKRLSVRELKVLSAGLEIIKRSRHHDIYDAVGIGLQHQGRL